MKARPMRALKLATISALILGVLSPAGIGRAHATCAPEASIGGEWRRAGKQLTGEREQNQEHFLDVDAVSRLQPAWTFDANEETLTQGNEVTGYPIVANGCVYVGTSTGFQTPGWIVAINADTGELVWRTLMSHGIYSTLAVEDGLVYAFVSRVKRQGDTTANGPYVVALDQFTGQEVWRRTVDRQVGSDAVSSPIVFDGMVWVGVSGTAAEVQEGDRGLFQGKSVLLEATDLDGDGEMGEILAEAFTIPEEDWENFSGGGQWGTIAIDPETGYGYVGTGNPFDYKSEHERTNSVIKLDVARARDGSGAPIADAWPITNPDFGTIVGSYKGNVEEYFPGINETLPCEEVEDVGGVFGFGLACAQLDLDFGGMPNIFTDDDGRKLVGLGQKSGVYHVFDADTMEQVWTSPIGLPTPVGGIVGAAAYDGDFFYGPHTVGGYLWSMSKDDGTPAWVSPTADVLHNASPVTLANDILYTVDFKGFLDAYDARTGLPILHRPMQLGADTHADPVFSWGGVTVARNTVYASVGLGATSAEIDLALPNGFVIAYRPFIPLP